MARLVQKKMCDLVAPSAASQTSWRAESKSAALAAGLSAFIYSRIPLLYIFYSNAPARLPRINNVKNLQVNFADQIRNCEDLAIDTHEGFALLSCDPGRDRWNTVMGQLSEPIPPSETGLYIWDYDTPGAVPEKLRLERFDVKAKTFHPLGIDYIASGRKLFVVNLAAEGASIELFKLSATDRKLQHMRSMTHELLSTPNAVAAYNNTHFFATNDHHFEVGQNPTLAKLETYLGLPSGTVVHGDRPSKRKSGQDLEVKVMDHVAFANGITLLNATTLAVASCSRAQVYLYNIDASSADEVHPSLQLTQTIQLPFLIDNIHSDKRGTLYLAGHPYPPSTEHVAQNAAKCASASKEGCEQDVKGLSWISTWSEKSGLQDLYVGDEYATSSGMVLDREKGIGIAVGLYAKGVLTWEMP